MASRPTHERRDTDAEIVPVVPQSQSENSHEDSRSQKSGFSSEKEAREDGLKSISQTESFDEEHAKNQQQGVTRIEALYRVYGNNRVAIWSLYISLAFVVSAFSLDQNTTSTYLPFATSYYGQHSLIAAIGTAELIIPAVSKPFISKIADITSRHLAYAFVLVLYVLGYLLVAATKTVQGLSVGRVFASVGEAGADQVTDIIVADLTPLEWRAFVQALTSAPNIPLAFVGGKIAGSIVDGGGDLWRWGYGMFCIILPVFIIPAILVLYFADRRATKIGELSFAASSYEKRLVEEKGTAEEKPSWFQLFKYYAVEADLIGLLLLAFGCSLFFLPFSLAAKAKGRYSNPSMIAMWVVGAAIIVGFSFYEKFVASKPVVNRRVFRNRAFVLAMAIDVLYFLSGFIRSTYLSSYIWIIRPDWSADDLAYFNNISTVALSVFGLLGGLWLRWTHRYKMLQLSGLVMRALGMGLSLYARKDHATDAALICTQLLIYIGGSFSVIGTRVASQASVPHADLAMVIAMLALFTKLGGAMGTTIAGAIWTNTMTENMRKHLPASVTDAQIAKYFASIRTARTAAPEIRAGIIEAYDETMFPMFLLAFCLSLPPILMGLAMPNYWLGKSHNAVETSLGIPQGSPLSSILYLFYNSSILEQAEKAGLTAIGCVDDVALVSTDRTTESAVLKLQNFIPTLKEWETSHKAKFNPKKTVLLNFKAPRHSRDVKLEWERDLFIEPQRSTTYLGLVFQDDGGWKEQRARNLAAAESALGSLKVISGRFRGLSTDSRRTVYRSLVLSQLHRGVEVMKDNKTFIGQMEKIQSQALRIILGLPSYASIDAMQEEANLWSVARVREYERARVGMKYLSAGEDHPLYSVIAEAVQKGGPSALASIINLAREKDSSMDVRGVEVIHLQPLPPWEEMLHQVRILPTAEEAIEQHEKDSQVATASQLSSDLGSHVVQAYSDGSDNGEFVGAGACIPSKNKYDTKYVGESACRVVYDGELVGAIRAIQLLSELEPKPQEAFLYVDNQAVLQVSDNIRFSASQALVLHLRQAIKVYTEGGKYKLTLAWIPGHEGVDGNEIADGLAKAAGTKPKGSQLPMTTGHFEPAPLHTPSGQQVWKYAGLFSGKGEHLPAVQSSVKRRIRNGCSRKSLSTSTSSKVSKQLDRRHQRIAFVKKQNEDNSAKFNYLDYEHLPRSQASLLARFRAGVPRLNYSLQHRSLALSSACHHCDRDETEAHFFLHCEKYEVARMKMRWKFGPSTNSLANLLFNPAYFSATLDFCRESRRFGSFFS